MTEMTDDSNLNGGFSLVEVRQRFKSFSNAIGCLLKSRLVI